MPWSQGCALGYDQSSLAGLGGAQRTYLYSPGMPALALGHGIRPAEGMV
ncbi:MAG: hypothetical protein ABIG44_11265 [Planctomycetota bacterium]